MNFILDENLAPSIATHLTEKGLPTKHVKHFGLLSVPDFSIFNFAFENDLIIITHDLDFSQIHAFSGKSKPSVILLRLDAIDIPQTVQLLVANIPDYRQELEQGSFIVIDKDQIRIRALPILKL